MTSPPPVPRRPGNVTAAGMILLGIAGLGLLACGGLTLLAGRGGVSDQDRELLIVVSAILVGALLLSAVLGYFILRGRQWARVTVIVLAVIGIAGLVVGLLTGAGSGGGNLLGGCLGITVNLLLIGLLSGSAASDYFRYRHR